MERKAKEKSFLHIKPKLLFKRNLKFTENKVQNKIVSFHAGNINQILKASQVKVSLF